MAKDYVERVVVLSDEEKERLERATEILKEIDDWVGNEIADDNVPLSFYENSEAVVNLLAMANNFPDD